MRAYFEILFLGTHSLEAAARLKHELEKSEAPVPVFVNSTNTTVVTSAGQTVYLYCGVQNLGDRAVRFIKKKIIRKKAVDKVYSILLPTNCCICSPLCIIVKPSVRSGKFRVKLQLILKEIRTLWERLNLFYFRIKGNFLL